MVVIIKSNLHQKRNVARNEIAVRHNYLDAVHQSRLKLKYTAMRTQVVILIYMDFVYGETWLSWRKNILKDTIAVEFVL